MAVKAFDTLDELDNDLNHDINVKICILVGWDSANSKWTVVDVDNTGAVKTV